MLYLGFSSRGERSYIGNVNNDCGDSRLHQVQLYKPEYGYHTHAYVITKAAAKRLLEHLPVKGPIDVWLADNHWFDIPVYCAVIANEGWKQGDGSYEGALLVGQNRRQGFTSDVLQSSPAARAPP
jgi:hypothetical protein